MNILINYYSLHVYNKVHTFDKGKLKYLLTKIHGHRNKFAVWNTFQPLLLYYLDM